MVLSVSLDLMFFNIRQTTPIATTTATATATATATCTCTRSPTRTRTPTQEDTYAYIYAYAYTYIVCSTKLFRHDNRVVTALFNLQCYNNLYYFYLCK